MGGDERAPNHGQRGYEKVELLEPCQKFQCLSHYKQVGNGQLTCVTRNLSYIIEKWSLIDTWRLPITCMLVVVLKRCSLVIWGKWEWYTLTWGPSTSANIVSKRYDHPTRNDTIVWMNPCQLATTSILVHPSLANKNVEYRWPCYVRVPIWA